MPDIKRVKNETPQQKKLRELQEERNKKKKFEYKPGSSTPKKPVKAKTPKKPVKKKEGSGYYGGRRKTVDEKYREIKNRR